MTKRALILLSIVAFLGITGCFLNEYKSDDGENNTPTVILSVTSSKFNTGDTIKCKAQGHDDESDINHYDWQVDGKDVVQSGNSLSHVFTASGDHTIKVRAVVSSDEKSEWADTTINIAKAGAPVAKLSVPATATIASKVTFSVSNDGAGSIEKCQWTIDGKDTTTEKSSIEWTFTDSSKIDKSITVAVVITNDKDVESDKVSKTVKIVSTAYPLHKKVMASCFWAGEGASDANDSISNYGSSWRSHWALDFGLEDHPIKIDRDSDHIPTSSKFTGKENPYYFALPYNDFSNVVYDGKGEHKYTDEMIGGKWGKKKSSQSACYWKEEASNQSACKNRWVEITDGGITVYAQWEDAGPYYYEDTAYVFGTAESLCMQEQLNTPSAGIDLSPSVWLYLGKDLNSWGITETIDSWRFIDADDVPDGPWKKHVTTSGTDWD